MTDFTLDDYLDIDQSIEKIGNSLFPDWEEGLCKKHRKEEKRYDGNYIYEDFLTKEQQNAISTLLNNNPQDNQETVFIFLYTCYLKKDRYSPYASDIRCSDKKIEINLMKKQDHQLLSELCKLHDVRNRIRQALVKEKLIAHVLNKEDGKVFPLESYIWNKANIGGDCS